MKSALIFKLTLLLICLLYPIYGYSQPLASSTPITHILAIGTVRPGVDPVEVRATLPAEVRATVNLYLEGKIEQWFSLEDRNGVVFILNVTDATTARDLLERLPLGQAHFMTFEIIPVGPLNPLRQLQGMRTGAP
jgi:hypothetical protein